LTAVPFWPTSATAAASCNSGQAVPFAGIDVTVWASDRKHSAGRLARQGSPALRWDLPRHPQPHRRQMRHARRGTQARPTLPITPCATSAPSPSATKLNLQRPLDRDR
jgi:hypothetical protein